jgi:hypothetical protein
MGAMRLLSLLSLLVLQLLLTLDLLFKPSHELSLLLLLGLSTLCCHSRQLALCIALQAPPALCRCFLCKGIGCLALPQPLLQSARQHKQDVMH